MEKLHKITVKKFLSLVIIILIVFLVFLLWKSYGTQSKSKDGTPVRLLVGSISFSQKDIDNKISLEKIYGYASTTEDIAIKILTNDAIDQEIARINKTLPSKKDIEDFNSHVNSQTKSLETLTLIKNIFGADKDSYDRIFLLPKVTNIKLHTFFASSTRLHIGEDKKIQLAFDEVRNGESFESVAKKFSLRYGRDVLRSVEDSMIDNQMNSYQPYNQPIIIPDFIKKIEVGGVTSLIERSDSFMFAKLLSKKGGQYEVESIVSVKNSYDDWHRDEVKKVKIKVLPKQS